MPKQLTTSDFVDKAKAVHGDRYIYTSTVYVNKYAKVDIECRLHGMFTIYPQSHYKGSNCPKCAKKTEIRTKGLVFTGTGKHTGRASFKAFSKKFDTSFYKKLKEVHRNKYVYDTTYFVKNKELDKIPINCTLHGTFWLTPKAHVQGQGCLKCLKDSKAVGIKELHYKAINIHNGKYTFDTSTILAANEKITITCNTCNKHFQMTLQNHVVNKQGCPYCRGMYRTINDIKKYVTNPKLTVMSDSIVNSNSILEVKCEDHGIFSKPVKHFISGRGCPYCAKHGFDMVKPAILYYLSINNGQAYKIGITNRSVKSRFTKEDLNNITVLREWKYQSGIDAFNKEKEIIEMYKDHKYTGTNLLKNGNTELFNIDVLGIDININKIHQCVS